MSTTNTQGGATIWSAQRLRDYAGAHRALGCGCGNCSTCSDRDMTSDEADAIADFIEDTIDMRDRLMERCITLLRWRRADIEYSRDQYTGDNHEIVEAQLATVNAELEALGASPEAQP